MADFYAPQINQPDIYGSFVRGQMAPLAIAQQQQDVAAGGLKLEQLRMVLQSQQAMQQYAIGRLQSESHGTQQAGAQNLGGPSGGIQTGPQASGYASNEANPLGMSPGTAGALAILRGEDPIKAATGVQDFAIKQRQLAVQGPMSLAESVISSDAPERLIMNNPSLLQGWQQYAPRLGLDPADPKTMTPANVRKAATLYYNDLAGTASLPPKAMPVEMQQIRGPNNQLLSRNPLTQEVKQEVPEESLHQVIGDNGQPVLLPASQAAGRQPFNQSIFGAANLSDQAIQFAADTYRATGKMPASFGRNPAMQAKVLDKVASDASASGDSAGAIAAKGAALKANGQALDQMTKLESATKSYYQTLDKNLDNLTQLAGKVDSTGSPMVNKVYRAWQQGVAGDPEVAKYVTYLNAVETEFAKIQSGSLGNAPVSDAAKRDAKDTINKFMSQGQIQAVAEAMRGEGNNRLQAIADQKKSLFGSLSAGPNGQAAPSGGHPPDIEAILRKVNGGG